MSLFKQTHNNSGSRFRWTVPAQSSEVIIMMTDVERPIHPRPLDVMQMSLML